MKSFSVIIRTLRELKGLNQEDIAKMMNVARTTYSSYEQGTREPPFDILIKLADFHEVSTDYLLGRDVETNDNMIIQENLISEITESQEYIMNVVKQLEYLKTNIKN